MITHFTTATQSTIGQSGAVVPCDPSQDQCQNGGFCVIIFGRDIQCTCRVGFTGKFCDIRENPIFLTTTTIAPAVQLCPVGIQYCKNDGQCLVILIKHILKSIIFKNIELIDFEWK
jgi:hypothetical protein